MENENIKRIPMTIKEVKHYSLLADIADSYSDVKFPTSITIKKLSQAIKTDDNAENDAYRGCSVNLGQEYAFNGIIGNICSVGTDFNNFTLFYVSINEGIRPKLIFRMLHCICKCKKINNFIKSITSIEHSNTHDIFYNEVNVVGKFIRNSKSGLIFKVTSIYAEKIREVHDKTMVWKDKFPYNLFTNLSDYVKRISDPNVLSEEFDDVQNIINDYTVYADGFAKLINTDDNLSAIMFHQQNYLNELFDGMLTSYPYLSEVTVKLRMILDDIIMMHTGLQTEEYDQLNVLYDVNCLNAMTDIMIILRTVMCINREVLNMKQVVLIMLIYINGFYKDYLDEHTFGIDTVKAYCLYNRRVAAMMYGLGFDSKASKMVYASIKEYIQVLLTI